MRTPSAVRSTKQLLIDKAFVREEYERVTLLRKQFEIQAVRNRLIEASGIRDEKLLDKLAAFEINADNFVALDYAPIVFTAWADGMVTPEERYAAWRAWADLIDRGQAASLFLQWLSEPPAKGLLHVWEEFAVERLMNWDVSVAPSFGDQIFELSKKVAAASGGILGVAAVSAVEHQVLERIASVYGIRDQAV